MSEASGLETRHPAIVTGGASGLGAAVARELDRLGCPVAVLDRQPAAVGKWFPVDLADGAAADALVRRIADEAGGLAAVVTCAGIDACGPLAAVERERWERVLQVNLLGTAAVIRAALPALERSGGRIVTVASTLGLRGAGDATAYCASKFGVVGFTRALAAELAGRVAVTLLIPGGMRTPFFDGREERYRPAPDARLADPEHVAKAVVFALTRPRGCEVRELLVCPSQETSWP
jgi:NAD(P)-dependent dehydrogenase (short-subunit alcohol dehydrogenase family)